MKDELQNKLVDILTAIQGAAGKASDFALSQLPDIAQSYVAYGRAAETALMLVFVALVVGGAVLVVRFGFNGEGEDSFGFWSPGRVLSAIVGGVGGAFGAIFFIANLGSFFLVWMAPKVWLLKEIGRLIK